MPKLAVQKESGGGGGGHETTIKEEGLPCSHSRPAGGSFGPISYARAIYALRFL